MPPSLAKIFGDMNADVQSRCRTSGSLLQRIKNNNLAVIILSQTTLQAEVNKPTLPVSDADSCGLSTD